MKMYCVKSTSEKVIIFVVMLFISCFSHTAHSQSIQVAVLLQQSPSKGGIITPNPGVHHFDLNTEVTLTAFPEPGYQFIYWLGDVTDPAANRTTAYLNKPKIIIAVFDKSGYESSFKGQGASGGRAYTSGGDLVNSGAFYGQSGFSGGVTSGPRPSKSSSNNYADKPSDKPYEPPIPEPATAILLALGGCLSMASRWSGKRI